MTRTEDQDIAGDAGAGPPEPAPEPSPLSADDTVPLVRRDLRVARGASPGLFDVTDPATGRKFTLYEFELAVARMLDGRRKVSEVVASGARLGVPIDLPGLYKFVRQLWHYGFLAAPGAAAEARREGTWADREQWDEATRTLYQTGLRLVRTGRPADAAGYFEAVLDAHPAHAEATEMLALIAKGHSLQAAPLGDRAEPPLEPAAPDAPAGPAPRRTARRLAVAALVLAAAAGAGLAALRLDGARAAAPPPAAAPPAPEAAASAPAPAAEPEPPRPRWRSAPVEARRHPALAEVVAPADGGVRWGKAAGAEVREGERLGELRAEVPGASQRLARRIAELERLAAQDPVYLDFLEKARREARRSVRIRKVALAAPAAGRLVRPAQPPGRAGKGEVLAQIVDPSAWHLGLVLEGEPPVKDAECLVLGDVPGERARCRVVEGSSLPDGGRAAVTAEVLEADAPWIGRAQSPYVRLAAPGAEDAQP